tara:strand:+ start:4059 stop:5195 length:1137 start_codon:yes stop_codon:yes gene_type:complete
MYGGKLISEGGFGCIFYPSVNCDGSINKKKDYVSKIQRLNFSAKSEIQIGEKVKSLKGYKSFFAPIVSTCSIDVKKVKDKDKNKCTVFKKKNNGFTLMKVPYINGTILFDHMLKVKNTSLFVSNILNNYNHLLKALKLLGNSGIVHFDIKGNNIMYNNDIKLPIIIDFGLSIQVNKLTSENLKKYFYIYAPDYYIWPIEVHYLCMLIHDTPKPSKEDILNLIEIYINSNKSIVENFSPDFIIEYKKLCYTQLVKYQEMGYKDSILKIITYWKTWDNYAFSLLYFRFIYFFNTEGYKENNFIVYFSKILLQNIHPNPEKRLSIEQTIVNFNSFLYKENDIRYDNIVKTVNNNREKINNIIVKSKNNEKNKKRYSNLDVK